MKILVVDDNKNITSSLEKYLKIKGFEVSVCNDGYDGFELIKNSEWDKVLLDLSMPEFSGLDIIENLEKNNVLKDKNIILFTASSIPPSGGRRHARRSAPACTPVRDAPDPCARGSLRGPCGCPSAAAFPA